MHWEAVLLAARVPDTARLRHLTDLVSRAFLLRVLPPHCQDADGTDVKEALALSVSGGERRVRQL